MSLVAEERGKYFIAYLHPINPVQKGLKSSCMQQSGQIIFYLMEWIFRYENNGACRWILFAF